MIRIDKLSRLVSNLTRARNSKRPSVIKPALEPLESRVLLAADPVISEVLARNDTRVDEFEGGVGCLIMTMTVPTGLKSIIAAHPVST